MEEYFTQCTFYDENDNVLNDYEKTVEKAMHYLVQKYVQSDMKVLELGARYGTVSACLNYVLNDPSKQLLCVDPDKRIENCLQKNKAVNNCTFNIFNGAVSKKELYVCYNHCVWESKGFLLVESYFDLLLHKVWIKHNLKN